MGKGLRQVLPATAAAEILADSEHGPPEVRVRRTLMVSAPAVVRKTPAVGRRHQAENSLTEPGQR